MATRRPKAPVTDPLRRAIVGSEIPLLVLAQATGVARASLTRFVRGQTSLRLDVADVLATYFGLELEEQKERSMAKHADTQKARLQRVKAYLMTKPGTPCECVEIRKATGVAKNRIDYEGSLSSDPEIRRERLRDEKGKYRVYWTYVRPAK